MVGKPTFKKSGFLMIPDFECTVFGSPLYSYRGYESDVSSKCLVFSKFGILISNAYDLLPVFFLLTIEDADTHNLKNWDLQCGSQIRPFKIGKHLKSKHFEDQNANGFWLFFGAILFKTLKNCTFLMVFYNMTYNLVHNIWKTNTKVHSLSS